MAPGSPEVGDDPLAFAGRVVLVTGGTRGVGRGIATRFAAAGATVVVCGRTTPEREDLAPGVEFVATDVRDAEAVAALVQGVAGRHGHLDVLVNNAGGSPPAAAATASAGFVAAIITLNLIAPFLVAQAANAVMQAQDQGGVIVNIGSVSGLRPSPGTAAYGAAKAGLANLTQTLAVEWAPRVRVNCVIPGMVRTELAHLHYGDADAVAAVGATVPLGHIAEPDEVADVCLFLASPLARYVTGASIVVHGGGERPAFLSAARPQRSEPGPV